MARLARRISESGYLHVIVRGIGKQLLFEDQRDYLYYLKLLARYKEDTHITICAYCLMENHVHLLLRDTTGSVALMMKKLGVSYSYYFNHKYDRSGHLFQDRYRSEPIDGESYLLVVFRYILNNPQKAGICSAKDYKWSSYHDYAASNTLVSTKALEELIGDRAEYIAFLEAVDDTECMEYNTVRDDQWAQRVIRRILKGHSGVALQQMDFAARNEALKEMKTAGLTVRQIERLTGINRGAIQRA